MLLNASPINRIVLNGRLGAIIRYLIYLYLTGDHSIAAALLGDSTLTEGVTGDSQLAFATEGEAVMTKTETGDSHLAVSASGELQP